MYEREGRDAVLECPTNAYSGFVKCTFTDPYGNDYLMVGRYAYENYRTGQNFDNKVW